MTTPHTPTDWWYVEHGPERFWFEDELTARTYLLLMRKAFGLKGNVDIFLGGGKPPRIGIFSIYGHEERCCILSYEGMGAYYVQRLSDGRYFRVSGYPLVAGVSE